MPGHTEEFSSPGEAKRLGLEETVQLERAALHPPWGQNEVEGSDGDAP